MRENLLGLREKLKHKIPNPSVMYRGGRPEGGREGGGNRRKSTLRISNSQNISNSATINASPGGDILNEHDSLALMNRRRKSVKNL